MVLHDSSCNWAGKIKELLLAPAGILLSLFRLIRIGQIYRVIWCFWRRDVKASPA